MTSSRARLRLALHGYGGSRLSLLVHHHRGRYSPGTLERAAVVLRIGPTSEAGVPRSDRSRASSRSRGRNLMPLTGMAQLTRRIHACLLSRLAPYSLIICLT